MKFIKIIAKLIAKFIDEFWVVLYCILQHLGVQIHRFHLETHREIHR